MSRYAGTHNYQRLDTPDFDLERDLLNEEELLGMGVGELAAERSFRVNIATIIISALIFLAILEWFEFMQTAFVAWIFPPSIEETIPATAKLWYAILVTILVLMLLYLIFYHSKNLKF